uniref:Cytoplasmic dynein 2 light intermediate chain 1 n=1 Tax=Angiostrongylus cantonensis TaxID=6313 RepID=A0A158PC14_ANGCA
MDIWSLAKEKVPGNEEKFSNVEKKMEDKNDEEDRARKGTTHLIICGNTQSGKSTMINKFLDKNEEPKETVALEYTYARRTRGNNKDVCHIWELGGGADLTQLLAIPLTKENIESATLVVVLDLTRPNELWITMETLIAEAKRHCETAIKLLNQNEETAMRHPIQEDEKICSWFPIPMLMVGTKYDEFQNLESEQRRRICTTLRFIAFYYGAHLMFYSCYHEQLVRVGRSVFSHFGFGSSVPKAKVIDHNKPIYITSGTDTVEVNSCQLESSKIDDIRILQNLLSFSRHNHLPRIFYLKTTTVIIFLSAFPVREESRALSLNV